MYVTKGYNEEFNCVFVILAYHRISHFSHNRHTNKSDYTDTRFLLIYTHKHTMAYDVLQYYSNLHLHIYLHKNVINPLGNLQNELT